MSHLNTKINENSEVISISNKSASNDANLDAKVTQKSNKNPTNVKNINTQQKYKPLPITIKGVNILISLNNY